MTNMISPLYLEELKNEIGDKYLNMQIITHNDMDGYSSAAVVYHAFKSFGLVSEESCSICHYNYSDRLPSIDRSADAIFITDYSLSNNDFKNDLLDAYKSNKFKIYWCDHHQTSIDACTGKYAVLNDIPGYRRTDYCGAALAWFYLHPGKSKLPEVLRLVDDFDCWKKKIPESDYINSAFLYFRDMHDELYDCKSDVWKTLITVQPVSKYFTIFNKLLDYGKEFCAKSEDIDYVNIRKHGWIGVLDKFPKIKMLCLNNDSKGSQLFSDLYKSKEHPNGKYNYACAFGYTGNAFTVSIYSSPNAKPNAQEICEAYGGGGHPGAGGFTTNHLFVHKVEDLLVK